MCHLVPVFLPAVSIPYTTHNALHGSSQACCKFRDGTVPQLSGKGLVGSTR
jgi:hypothetical protein